MILILAFAITALTLPPAVELRRLPAEEATQGVAADARHVYAISNSRIGKYDRRTGKRVAQWRGDPEQFRHMNSCTLIGSELVCAASNYPEVPQASSIEWFDTRRMAHIGSRSLGPARGSLTWLEWHDGTWWAGFANYDGRGGERGRDHRSTTVVRYDRNFQELGAWLLPVSVLERMAPYSASGGAWKGDRLYVTGHDEREVYVLQLPAAGSRLIHRATFAFSSPGQAIQWDKGTGTLWSIDRSRRELVESQVASGSPALRRR
ncbi:MAG TPA: hypothetical protein VD768_06335 [Sphingomicrobium sp.]|nr:hypothetical protein [Sphingomicrobium sp.]